jgi:hypothetical protein
MPLAPIASNRHVVPKSGVVARGVADEMVLLDLESGVYFTLNAVGSLVWAGLEQRAPLETILSQVVDAFEVEDEVASSDIAEYVASLMALGLVEIEQ